MPHAILDGLSLVDSVGRIILATTVVSLLAAIVTNLFVRARYRSLELDLARNPERFSHRVLNLVVEDALAAARHGGASNTQAIIEQRFQSELKPLLLAERYVKAATGLVIILGLLGTFYGLTLSIGRIVALVSSETGAGSDAAGTLANGLTHALAGMAVAFSNSLLGIASAVVLTLFGVFSNVTDRRVAVMLQLETLLDRVLPAGTVSATGGAPRDSGIVQAVARLEEVVARFESGLRRFSDSAGEFHEFNVHLKDNIQRMSLSFGDFSDSLKSQLLALKPRDGRP